jgi:hypothetical protein
MFDTKKPARIPVSDRRDPKSFETREPWQACERLNRGHDEDFVETDISSSGHPRQDVRDRDLADFDTIDHDRKGMAGHENFAGSVTGRAGLGMDQDLPPDHVEDPIEGDPHARINAGHLEVFIQTEMSDLDQEGDIDRFGVALLEFLILSIPPDDRQVRLRLVKVRDSHRCLRRHAPPGSDDPQECVSCPLACDDVEWFLGDLPHQDAVDQVDPVIVEDTRHPLVFIDGDPVHRERRR